MKGDEEIQRRRVSHTGLLIKLPDSLTGKKEGNK